MWTTVALLSVLSCTPAQAGQLELKNARFTYGILGKERKDNTFLPGDMVVLSFNIEGLKVKDDGTAQYSMALELYSHKKGKNLFENVEPPKYTVTNSLGGTSLPGFALTNLLTESEPGEYTMRVKVNDLLGKTAAKPLERKFTVKPLEFALVRPGFVYLPLNEEQAGAPPQPAPPLAVPGQNLLLHVAAVGFTEAGPKNQPKLSIQAVIQDEAGKPVLKKPFTGMATEYGDPKYKEAKFIPFTIPIQVNRSGKFKIVVSATDENSGKTVTLPPLDLTAVEIDK